MNIVEFFQQRAGSWISHRTSHHLIIKKAEDGTSEINLEMLSLLDPEVIELCNQHGFDPESALCAAKVTWDGTMAWDTDKNDSKHKGFTIFVPIANDGDIQQGKLLRHQGYAEKAPVVGRYVMGDDDVLSLITEYETLYSEEKFWFPNPDLCLRAGLTTGLSNVSSFCTEIRKAPPNPPEQTESPIAQTTEYFSLFGG
ncbi:phycobiliprotein lyase [Tumidithrix elongata RA019]|uniref:Chromophore lyase CpcS/CpeS n=1 Tax=Tumidithrix elongata BACA0141 TaxID=2716417 RepID=A0AAW9PYD3_9CYAN|nr:phycobiliprotein lyase [Tumidithrix elongata RA019]